MFTFINDLYFRKQIKNLVLLKAVFRNEKKTIEIVTVANCKIHGGQFRVVDFQIYHTS